MNEWSADTDPDSRYGSTSSVLCVMYEWSADTLCNVSMVCWYFV